MKPLSQIQAIRDVSKSMLYSKNGGYLEKTTKNQNTLINLWVQNHINLSLNSSQKVSEQGW